MIVLITGGARSGKSGYAERLLAEQAAVLYIATAKVFDEEMRHRVAMHRAQRPANWTTHEGYRDLAPIISASPGAVLMDCVTNMITNILFDHPEDWDRPSQQSVDAVEADALREVGLMLDAMDSRKEDMHILVTNELGMGVVPPTPLGRHFRDIAGRINQRIAARSDCVVLMVSGIPVVIQGSLSERGK